MRKTSTYGFVELNLSVCQVTKHLLHLCFLSVLEYLLLAQGFFAKRIGRLMGCSDSFLKLVQVREEGAAIIKYITYLLYLAIELSHLLDTTPIVIRAS